MLTGRNYPPDHGIRVPTGEMSRLVVALLEGADMPTDDAALLASWLVSQDTRCVYSHGTRTVPYYVKHILDGGVNPRPRVRVVDQSSSTAVVDGDGGLGYFAAHRGTLLAIDMAVENGVAAVTTRNHFHIGSAGLYSRLALARDCIGMVMSGHRTYPRPEAMILDLARAFPFSVAVPSGDQPPLVLDMGAGLLPKREDLYEQFPNVFFKNIGLAAIFMSLGGILAGAWKPEFREPASRWTSNQGAFIAVFDVRRFMPIDEFKAEVDTHISAARRMKPFPGMRQAELPGGLEWQWERENGENGILVSDEHRRIMETAAQQLGISTPFERFEHSRF